MYRTILVPVDGSPLAERAIPWALALAGSGQSVRLVHVHVAPAPMLVEGVVVSDPALDGTIRAQEDKYLVELSARAAAAVTNVAIASQTLDTDAPLADAVAAAATEHGAGLVVMTTHGRGPLARFLLGSVTDETVRHSPVPVLVVRVEESQDDLPPADLALRPSLRHVLVPLDGSALAETIIPAAAELAKAFSADIGLLAVVDPSAKIDAEFGPANEKADTYLGRIASEVERQHGIRPVRVVRQGLPVEVITATTAELGETAIALATHGRAGLSRLFHGSVADEVIRSAVGPVLVYHPAE